MNVAAEYVFGVRTGSTPSRDRRKSGADVVMNVGKVLCRSVIDAIDGGRANILRERRFLRSARGACVVGVSMSFVRTMSSGARRTPAMPAAATATPNEASGYGESTISRPPTPDPASTPGSGTLRSTLRRLLVHDSIVLRSTL